MARCLGAWQEPPKLVPGGALAVHIKSVGMLSKPHHASIVYKSPRASLLESSDFMRKLLGVFKTYDFCPTASIVCAKGLPPPPHHPALSSRAKLESFEYKRQEMQIWRRAYQPSRFNAFRRVWCQRVKLQSCSANIPKLNLEISRLECETPVDRARPPKIGRSNCRTLARLKPR